MAYSEEHIARLLAKQDSTVVGIIYNQYAPKLYGLVLRIVQDESLAQDVMQDSFTKIWKNSHSYDPKKARLFTWLMRICRNTAIDKLRSKKTRAGHEIQTGDYSVSNNEIAGLNVDALDLSKHLSTLEQKYIDVIEGVYYKGYTQAQLSERLGIPLGTVKTRLKIALKSLRKIYINELLVFSFINYLAL